MQTRLSLHLITLIVATCSMAYEILFAQMCSILFGSTVMQYTATIGLYLFSLGLGSIIYVRKKIVGTSSFLIWVELALSFFGAASPVALLLVAGLLPSSGDALIPPAMAFSFIFVVIVGILTGLELPCLMDLAGGTATNNIQILSWDLIGTFIGGPLVLFFLYPVFGIISAAAMLGMLNIVVAFFLMPGLISKRSPILISSSLMLLTGGSIFFNEKITHWLTELTF